MRAPQTARAGFAALGAIWLLACGAGVPTTIERPPLSEHNRALYARTNLQKARALRAEGRLEMAASAARRGLEFQPDNAELHRIRANVLERLGQVERARAHRERAAELEPPPTPLDDLPHPLANTGANVRMVLLPPSVSLLGSSGSRNRVPRDWPRGPEAEMLRERLRARLPHATQEIVSGDNHPSATTVSAARQWLNTPTSPDAVISLRVERAFCGSSIKDGDFAVAWLRVAAARPGDTETSAHLIRVSLDTPLDASCNAAAVAVAVERTLELSAVKEALRAETVQDAAWAGASLRVVLPELDAHLRAEIDRGRRYLSIGELALALEHFARAREIDPDDAMTAAFFADARRSLDMMRLLTPSRTLPGVSAPPPSDGGHLGPQLSRAQRSGLEAQLAHEQRRREEMLSALAVLYELRSAPTLGTVANMRRADLRDPSGTGVALAMARISGGGAVEVRTLYAPDGGVLARYYFAENSEAPVLREEDMNADGAPDRWVGYERGVVSEIWESDFPGGPPTLHLVYGPGGTPIERVELDHDGDGRLDRLFVYDAGRLREESWDTNGDGAYDRWQQFDETGSLTLREEDIDGDEEVDVRTAYNKGRIIRREILNADLLSEFQ